ncbi:hypothetical protein CROQUDRAFT_91219 [Cronartium quercuum f. sp. fusiforme G11]|uniref:Uncharacterized protein n=1 Tax=Cronartium quercuum f. sp. fusiforme G11 TaxID=708437 RepID=A0A9P6NP87_9BASI|nr:hypothetical protein CROQUDRAFT_91219 [Cronartium quercuum f. sp. fusiforme G11]
MPDEPTTNYDWKSAKFQAGLPTMVKNAGDRLKDDGGRGQTAIGIGAVGNGDDTIPIFLP